MSKRRYMHGKRRRRSPIKDVDTIHLIRNGKIVESGKYSHLMNNSKSQFKKLVNLQKL